MTAPDRYAPSEYNDLCFVGPLGALQALPDVAPNGGTSVSVTRIGGMHRALAGGMTVDTFARKRTWTWSWDMLLEKQITYVEALQWGHIRGPLRLIDPRRYNRLPEEIASCGTTSGSARMFLTDSNTAAYWTSLADMPGDVTTLGPRQILSGGLEWQIITPSADENFLLASDPRYTDSVFRVPVLPNETVEVSMWALYPATVSFVAGFSWRDVTGTFITSDVTDVIPGEGDSWKRISISVTAPDGAVFGAPFFSSQAPYLPTATSIYTTAWQVASPGIARLMPPGITEHCDIPDIAGDWRQGGGAPYVVADVGDSVYSKPGFHNTALTLIET